MLHIALTSSNPWMLVVPYVVKKVTALPKMLGGAYELLSAPERIEYGLELDPEKYRKARPQLAAPAVQAKLLEFGQAALLLYKYWDFASRGDRGEPLLKKERADQG